MNHRLLNFTAATVAIAAAAGLPAAAQAAPDWTAAAALTGPPTTFGDFMSFGLQDSVGYAADGSATSASIEAAFSPAKTVLHVGSKPVGGSYRDDFTVASSKAGTPVAAAIAVAPSGAAVVEWTETTDLTTGAPGRYRAAYRPAGSSNWDKPITIATDPGKSDAKTLVPAISADGAAAAGLLHDEPDTQSEGETDVQADVVVKPKDQPWGSTVRISPVDESAPSLALGFDGQDNLTAAMSLRYSEGAFSQTADDLQTIVVRRRSSSNGVFGAATEIAGEVPNYFAQGPVLGVNADGDAVVAYQYLRTSGPTELDVWGSTRTGANGSWTAPQRLSDGHGGGGEAAGVTPKGIAYVNFTQDGQSSADECDAATRAPVGTSFPAGQCVSALGVSTSGRMTLVGEDARFGWSAGKPGGSFDAVQGTRWAAAADHADPPTDLVDAGTGYTFSDIVPDGLGGAAAILYSNKQVSVADFDAGAPVITKTTVPATAVAGESVPVSAEAFDVWTPLAGKGIAWDFGDGSAPVAGATAAHTYAAAGQRTMTLTVADAHGNTTTKTFAIDISGPAATPVADTTPVATTTAVPATTPVPTTTATATPVPTATPVADHQAPTVAVTRPACAHKLSRHACARHRVSARAWRVVRGTTADPSGVASVTVAVVRGRAAAKYQTADLLEGHWSLLVRGLHKGRYTISVRATDTAGNVATTSRHLRLH